MNAQSQQRSGTILIIVAGLSALLAALGITFITRMRSDSEENAVVLRDMQARIMLLAGCDYVLEAGRLGYDKDADSGGTHEEGFGWIDVRTGADGPLDQNGNKLWSMGAWPAIGTGVRCPMHVLERPPYAIRLTQSYNPISTEPGPAFGQPYLAHRDPRPVTADWDEFKNGDRSVRRHSSRRSWFRVWRESAAVFVITCGAGASEGFKDWNEVGDAGRQSEFGDDDQYFAQVLREESRLWYRIEWSSSVPGMPPGHFLDGGLGLGADHAIDHYYLFPVNATQMSEVTHSKRSQPRRPNMLGTIRWVQRLSQPPTMY
jgi:hypothetical protein